LIECTLLIYFSQISSVITYNGETVAKLDHFTEAEKALFWEMKHLITDPEVTKQKQEQYPTTVKHARELFAGLYETPQPIIEEPCAKEYLG